jgi:hypothetical protein
MSRRGAKLGTDAAKRVVEQLELIYQSSHTRFASGNEGVFGVTFDEPSARAGDARASVLAADPALLLSVS